MTSTPPNPAGKRYCIPSEKQMLDRVALFQRAMQGTSDVPDSAETEAAGLVSALPAALPVGDTTSNLGIGVPDSSLTDSSETKATALVPATPVAGSTRSSLNGIPESNLTDYTEIAAPVALPAMRWNPTSMDFLNLFQNPFSLTGNTMTRPIPTFDGIKSLALPTEGITVPNWVDILFSMSSGYTGTGHIVNSTAIGGNSSTNPTSRSAPPLGLTAWTNPVLASTGPIPSTRPTQCSLSQGPMTLLSPTRKLHMMHQALLSKPAVPLTPGTPEFEILFKEALEYAENNPIYEDRKIACLRFYVFNPEAMKIPQKIKIRPAIARDLYFQCYGRHAGTIDAWRKMKGANTQDYQEWMERAGKLSEEILEQIRRGYIYGDTGLKMGSVRSFPRWRD